VSSIRHPDRPALADRAAAQQRLHPHQQLGEREGFGEVIVRSGLKILDLAGGRVLRGQDHHGDPRVPQADPPQELEAADPRKGKIEEDEVVRVGVRHRPAGFALRGDVDGEPRGLETAGNQFGHLALIFDDQDAHAPRYQRFIKVQLINH